ncbi:ABC transporter ATP-binding protein [Streptomyces sp. 549]|uniref:ABC transporter ATP-binding protein n=1 Tax=Streptomyces sp. 549 TaxID=3049076 RepID=UPI0024C389F8|nr:ABC transporter ATP-binding protein [Streptomyces sp. 549]MDK1475132.1 ABC transporter ATP-binding protein [Streptomyces sp. 549]
MTAITLSQVSKVYGDVTAVHPLDLTIPEGSFFALLGASGCGKTTTLRMIAGLEEPTTGRVLLGEQDITALPPHRRPVNTVFQNYALFPHLSVHDNVAFGLRRRGITSVTKQVEEMLELVELGGLGRRRPRQLSGGQQQRVALARALINRPSVLLLDEPLGALDLKLRRQMQLELKRIQTDVGITFVHVTHDQEEAMTMADSVAVMYGGRVEQQGAPAELYENPRSTFVANFLGTSNLVRADVEDTSGPELTLTAAGSTLRLPAGRAPEGTARGSAVFAGVRPEKITMVAADAADTVPAGHNQLTGTITDAGFLGVSTHYLVSSPANPELAVYAQNTGLGARLTPGTDVVLHWQPEHTFALDASQAIDAGTEEATV